MSSKTIGGFVLELLLTEELPDDMKEGEKNPVDNKNEDFIDGYKTGYNHALRECKRIINFIRMREEGNPYFDLDIDVDKLLNFF